MIDWARVIVRIISIGFATFVGMILGAVVLYIAGSAIYLAIWPGPVTNGYECARGMFWGYLLILTGELLGAFLGAFIAHRLFNDESRYKEPVFSKEDQFWRNSG